METVTEQPKTPDEILDEQLMAADQSPEVPVTEEPKAEVPEVVPETPAEEPAVDTQAILAERDALAKKVEELSKDRDGLVSRVKAMRGKSREVRESLQRQLDAAQKRLDAAQSAIPKAVDPLQAWRSDPDNERVAPPDEVLSAHDAFILEQAQKAQAEPQQDIKLLAQKVDAAMFKASHAEQTLVQLAADRRWITPDDIARMAQSENPAKAAVEIAKAHFDQFGSDEEIDLVHRLFPESQAQPAQPSEPARPAAPSVPVQPKVAAPAQKPKEQSDEADYEPEGFGPSHRAIAHMFFG